MTWQDIETEWDRRQAEWNRQHAIAALPSSICAPRSYVLAPPTYWYVEMAPLPACDGCGASHRTYHRTRQCMVCAYCGRDV